MSSPRVRRSRGPGVTMTAHTYRKKALKHLIEDFAHRCAYCLQFLREQHRNQVHIDHFDAHRTGRKRHQYGNLMLACPACNLSKRAKLVADPKAPERRLLNCTKENEFPEHIVENDRCEWVGRTPAGDYHIAAIDLNESSHIGRRRRRKAIHHEMMQLHSSAIRYRGSFEPSLIIDVLSTIAILRDDLKTAVPFATETGLVSPGLPAGAPDAIAPDRNS